MHLSVYLQSTVLDKGMRGETRKLLLLLPLTHRLHDGRSLVVHAGEWDFYASMSLSSWPSTISSMLLWGFYGPNSAQSEGPASAPPIAETGELSVDEPAAHEQIVQAWVD
jgi:hypothetical protein